VKIVEDIYFLKDNRYKGQLIYEKKFSGKNVKKFKKNKVEFDKELIIPALDEFLREFSKQNISELSLFERFILSQIIEKNNNLFINNTRFPGVYNLISFVAASYHFATGLSTLIISNYSDDLKELNKNLKKLDIINLFSREEIQKEILEEINVISGDLRFFLYDILENRTKKFKEWLDTLGLIIVYNITSFNTLELLHLSQFLNVLRVYLKERKGEKIPSFMIFADKLKNPEVFINKLLPHISSNIYVVEPDLSYSSYSVYYWVPPYLINDQHRTQRNDFYEEVKNLISILRSKGGKGLFVHGFSQITKGKLREIIGEIENFKIVNDISMLGEDDFKNYDYCILLGVPRDIKYKFELLPLYLKEGGEIFVVLPDDNISFYFLKSEKDPESVCEYQDYLILTPSFELLRKYVSLYIDLEEKRFLSIEKWRKILEESGIKEEEKENLTSTSEKNIVKIKDFSFPEVPYGCLSSIDDTKVIIFPDNSKIFFDSTWIPDFIFDETLIYKDEDEMLYEVRENEKGWEATPVTGPILRIPLLKIVDLELPHKPAEKYSINNINLLYFDKAKLKIEFSGYKEYFSYNKPPNLIKKDKKEYEKILRALIVLEFNNSNISHPLSHLIADFFSLKYKNFREVIKVRPYREKIVIYSPYPGFELESYLSDFRESLINKFPEFAAELLLRLCPCQNGCPLCIESPWCEEEEKIVNKKEVLKFLFNFSSQLKNNKIDQLNFQLKYNGIHNKDDAHEIYTKIKDRILGVYEEKLNIKEDWVPMIVVTPEEMEKIAKGAQGVYTGDKIFVITGLLEERVYEVIAHEYGHQVTLSGKNFKIHPSLKGENIPFKGKLFEEGAAEWLTFRIMDHFGYKHGQEIQAFYRFDEYGEGFRVLYWLEDKVGLYGVLKFLVEGKIKVDGEILGPSEVIKKSGLWERILQKKQGGI